MPVDSDKINAIYERLTAADLNVQAGAVADAGELAGPELTALLKPYGSKFAKFKKNKADSDEWYINEASWGFDWSNGGAEVFFNRPGKSWAKKRDNVRRLIWNGSHLLNRLSGFEQLPNLEELELKFNPISVDSFKEKLAEAGIPEVLGFNSLAPLQSRTKLKKLYIGRMVLNTLGEIKGMTHLEELELASPKNPSDLLETLATLTGLRKLKCTVPAGADVSFLANLTKLEDLKLETYSRDDAPPTGHEAAIGQLNNLVKIDLSWDREQYSWEK